MSFLMFYITTPDKQTAEDLGVLCLKQRLAACYNLFPMSSQYWWQGRLEASEEWVLILKTTHTRKIELTAFIQAHHPYQVPCIVHWTVESNAAYSTWIAAETSPSSES